MASSHANLIWEQTKFFTREKSPSPTGFVWNTSMAAVTLFWNTNMAAVTSCEYSPTGPSSFEGWPRDRAKSSKVINENEMTVWGKILYQPGLMQVITEIRYTVLLTPVTNKPMLWSMTSSILCFWRHFLWTRAFYVSCSVIEVIFFTGNFNQKFSSICCAFRMNDDVCLAKSF